MIFYCLVCKTLPENGGIKSYLYLINQKNQKFYENVCNLTFWHILKCFHFHVGKYISIVFSKMKIYAYVNENLCISKWKSKHVQMNKNNKDCSKFFLWSVKPLPHIHNLLNVCTHLFYISHLFISYLWWQYHASIGPKHKQTGNQYLGAVL